MSAPSSYIPFFTSNAFPWLRTVGAYAYRFWMAPMTPRKRCAGNPYLHQKFPGYRDEVKRKMAAYHHPIQLALIAQGLLQFLSIANPAWSGILLAPAPARSVPVFFLRSV
jgi:hypothetical protein